MTIRLSPQAYRATLRDLGHAWVNDWPPFNYRVKRSARMASIFTTLGTDHRESQ